MSIARRTTRDPLTGPPNRLDVGATGMEVKAVPLESLAAKELHSQVEIYCRRWIPGRSILIGGDRGSGKTTLARSVVDQLLASGTLASDIQPLFVPIHGPDFFDGVDDESVAEGSVGTATDPQAKQQRREQAGARFALRVLTIGLHRAFVTELGWALERTAAELRAKGQTLHLRPSFEVNEIVAQLRLDLDAEVEVSSLRWVWEQLEALDKGVLGRPATVANAEYWTHQGLLEILATKSLIEGYIRVAGKVEDLKRTTLRAQLKVEASSEGSQKLANTIAGALSGSAAGAGILLQSGDSIGKSLLGALAVPVTAFLTSSLLNLATKRSVDRRDFEERKISFDKSLESLDLIFPLLVNRVLDAGRAPIFVVDELDKVLNTDERLRDLIPRLKHIVSDKAFFCFLVGRDCFEKIQGTIRAEPHGRESTFFSRRLYVNQSPSEWRDYLIGKSIPGKSLIQSIAENSASGGILFSDATDSATRGSEAAYLFRLSYFALARSRMHAGDLHKSMDSWPTIQSSISSYRVLAPIDLESLHFKNQVIYQAAVEVVLRDPQLADRIAVDTEFRQSMYDRLYQPLQEWEIGAGTTAPVPVPLPADESLLQIAVTELLSLLADPAKIAVRSAGANPQAVADLDLQNILGKPRPLVVLNFNGSWRWLVDFWGRDVPLADGSPSEVHRTSITRESGPPEQMPKAEILRIIESIQGLDSDIRASTDSYLDLNRLAVELRLLNLSPPFSNFQSAAMRYQAESGAGEVESGYASLTSDKRVIGEYYGLINQSMRAIKQSFFLAELMAKSLPGSVSPLRIYNCLLTLSDEFEFAAISASEIESILESHGADFRERGMFEADLAMAEKSLIGPYFESLVGEPWLTLSELQAMGEFVGQRLWPGTEIANSIQDYYQDRFEALVRAVRLGERMVETRIYGLMLRAADLVGRFRGSPDTVTLGNYARLLAECMTYPVEEFQLALLAALGFGARVQDFVVRDRIRFPTDRAEKLIDISRRKTTAGERVLLVLRDPPVVTQIGEERVIQAKLPASSYAEWFASKQHAVFPVFAGSQAMLPPLVDGVFTLVLLDGYCDVISTAQPTNAFITAFLLSSVVPKVRLVNKGDIADASAQLPRLFPTGVPELTEMQFLDDTISQARRVLPSPAATSVTAGVG